MPTYLGPSDILEIMPISRATAYRMIKRLNAELESQGYLTLTGKVPLNYFLKRYCLDDQKEKDASTNQRVASNE